MRTYLNEVTPDRPGRERKPKKSSGQTEARFKHRLPTVPRTKLGDSLSPELKDRLQSMAWGSAFRKRK